MNGKLNNKVILITGISRGIGRELAYKFARKGATIIGVARNKDEVDILIEKLMNEFGIQSLSFGGNVSNPSDINCIISNTIAEFSRIDVLINNAGVGSFDFVTNLNDKSWNEMIDTNLKGVYISVKSTLPAMIKQKQGAIINISSICGIKGYAQCTGYCASKFGIVGFSDALAKEVAGYNISVYVLCPDIVDTSFANSRNSILTDKNKMLTTGEVATVVSHLLEKRSKSQICLVKLHLLTRIFRKLGIKKRIVQAKRIRYI